MKGFLQDNNNTDPSVNKKYHHIEHQKACEIYLYDLESLGSIKV